MKGLVKNTQVSSSNDSTAPNYVNSQHVDTGRPKRRNLAEGGFEDNAKNASFNQDIRGKNDPGRLAEQKFQRKNANTVGIAGMPNQQGRSGDDIYDTLSSDTSA